MAEQFRHLTADEYLKLSLEQRLDYIQRLTAELKAEMDRSKKVEKPKPEPKRK
jgi:hypothetical protein